MIFVIRSVSGCFYDVATHAWRGAAEQGTPIRDRLVADRIASALGHMRAEVVALEGAGSGEDGRAVGKGRTVRLTITRATAPEYPLPGQ
jgi:hypothetical protein